MALWTATNRGGGRALRLAIPAAFPCPIFSHFTQGAMHGDENDSDNDVLDRKRESDESGIGEMAGFVAEKAKKGTRKVVEMMFATWESKAEGKKESWGYWKETTQKMKEDLLGADHEKNPHHRSRRPKLWSPPHIGHAFRINRIICSH